MDILGCTNFLLVLSEGSRRTQAVVWLLCVCMCVSFDSKVRRKNKKKKKVDMLELN
jgi:hypothetical protein